MELAVYRLTACIDHFEGMRAVAIHVTVAIRQSSIAEQEGHLAQGIAVSYKNILQQTILNTLDFLTAASSAAAT